MDRRTLLGQLLGVSTVSAVAIAMPVPPERALAVAIARPVPAERALTAVSPYCPRCGSVAMFERRHRFPGELVPVHCARGDGPAGCGWTGVSLALMPQTEWPQ
jgi:hypothetical protein